MNYTHAYDDIIDLPHHVSATRKPMPLSDRAAQFAPFAALTGYEDAIEETARLTDTRDELDEDSLRRLNQALVWLREHIREHPSASVTYFEPDKKKTGGRYVTVTGKVNEINECDGTVIFSDRKSIPFADISEIHTGSDITEYVPDI